MKQIAAQTPQSPVKRKVGTQPHMNYAIAATIADPSCSDALRTTLKAHLYRDPCDAAADLEYAAKLFAALAKAAMGRAA
jgi:hypothetical protein